MHTVHPSVDVKLSPCIEYHADGAVVEHSPVGSLPGIKVKGPASAASLKSSPSRSKEPTPASNVAASHPKKVKSPPKKGASHTNPKALRPITTASRPGNGSSVNAAASRLVAAVSKPKKPAARPEESDEDFGSDGPTCSMHERVFCLYQHTVKSVLALLVINRVFFEKLYVCNTHKHVRN